MSATLRADVAHARRRLMLVGVIVPLVLIATAVVLQFVWLPELPNPAATHFGGSGPDGSGAAITYPLMTGGVGLGMVGIVALVGFQSSRTAGWGPTARFLGAFVPAAVIALTVGLSASVFTQRGIADWRHATDPGLALLVGALIGAVYGVIAWFAQPNLVVEPADLRDAQPALAAAVAPAYATTVMVRGTGRWVIIVALAMTGGLAIASTVRGVGPLAWLWILSGAVLVLTLTMFAFRVRVDANGFVARSIVGVPVFRISLNEIAAVRTLTVNALGDFGGWGLRYMPGNGLGIVLHSGPAVQIERTTGKKLTVTLDDAERVASLLESRRQAAAGTSHT